MRYYCTYYSYETKRNHSVSFRPTKEKSHYSELKEWIKDRYSHTDIIITLMKKMS